MTPRFFLTASAAFAAALATPASAQQAAVSLKGDVKVIHTIVENGKSREKFDEPTQVLPGDKLVFTTHFNNASDKPVTDFVITNPLPAPVKLAKQGSFEVSVDGGKSFGMLASLKIANADGSKRPADLGDVNAIRWKIPSIAPGASGDVTYLGEVR